jgi:uncharacterized protein involved in type VI secretion and phage assembly
MTFGQDGATSETTHEAGGFVKGVAIAVVTQNKDPDGLCRVKVSYPWHSKSSESYWARIAVAMAGKDRGMVFLPEVGDEVLVVFEREDMRFPYVLGSLWNGQEKPPESNANGQNDIRVIKTRKGHTLLFDDNSSKGRIELKLNDGKKLSIDDDGIKLDDGAGNSLEIDSKGGAMTLQAATKLTLKAPSISVEAATGLTLKGSATVTVQGGMVNIN